MSLAPTSKLGTPNSAFGNFALGAPDAVTATDGLNAWSRGLGIRQGRLRPVGWVPSDGSYAFALGSDTAGEFADLRAGDYASVSQIADIAPGTKVLRISTRLRGPQTDLPAGLNWRFSLFVDDVEATFVELKAGKTFDKVDLAANVAKLSGPHRIEIRVGLILPASTMTADLVASSATMHAAINPVNHLTVALTPTHPTMSAAVTQTDHVASALTYSSPIVLAASVAKVIPLIDLDFTNHTLFPIGTMTNAAFLAASGITHTGPTDATIVSGGLTMRVVGASDVYKILAASTALLVDAGRISLEMWIDAASFWGTQTFWNSADGFNSGTHNLTSILSSFVTNVNELVPAGGGGFGPHWNPGDSIKLFLAAGGNLAIRGGSEINGSVTDNGTGNVQTGSCPTNQDYTLFQGNQVQYTLVKLKAYVAGTKPSWLP